MFNALSVGYRLTLVLQDDPDGAGLRPLDLTLYSVTELLFVRPDGSAVTKTATKTTPPGADGKIYYETDAGFFRPTLDLGRWKFRGHVRSDAAHDYYSDWQTFDLGE